MSTTVEKCPNCGIPVGSMPEDAANDEMLCNACYETSEQEQSAAYAAAVPDEQVIEHSPLPRLLTKEQARDLHKILRAVHDGVCPKCGRTSAMTTHQDFVCLCGFTVSGGELQEMEAAVPLALSVAVETFETWQTARVALNKGGE